jgi:hypothetical protein
LRGVFFYQGETMSSTASATNRLAIYSLLTALLTAFSFCIGAIPILPMTAPFCYPAAIVLGIVALVTGTRALRQIRLSGERGRTLALLGIWVGALSILAVLCAVTLTGLLLYYGADYFWSLWAQGAH